ncbi:hypothetical protein Back2_28800 [Nocardioides baekrokdamisoli]|uniref:Uncharacterized protein n=1 Tax=Nocardioides baekrokdamisoli TaxID=1804624 RepID=A0A3G9J1Q1_9ACTN|nr:hypothetical protein Back2_28800 [Nocardioides baekrokdamisoli]
MVYCGLEAVYAYRPGVPNDDGPSVAASATAAAEPTIPTTASPTAAIRIFNFDMIFLPRTPGQTAPSAHPHDLKS